MKKQKTNNSAKEFDRILLSKNLDIALLEIENLKKRAAETNEIIKVFNDINLLNPVISREHALEFLQDPILYFDNALISDIKFSADPQPPSEGIALFYKIDYEGIVEKIGACKLRNLENYVFNEDDQTISFDQKCTKKIQESFYDYTKTAEETEAVIKIRELCKLLNEHCTRWNVDNSDMNIISNRLGLRCEIIPGHISDDTGHGGYFIKENITVIRSILEHEKLYPEE